MLSVLDGIARKIPPPLRCDVACTTKCDVALWRFFTRALDEQVTVGATEGLYASIKALVGPGDEVRHPRATAIKITSRDA